MEEEARNEQNHEVGVDARRSQSSWESKDSLDEAARSGLGGSSMRVVGGGSKEMKKESRLSQVEVNVMEREMIAES
jgi:hypothetical protein